MKCNVHPDVDAVGTCTNCGKTVCANCAIEMNGKVVCKSCIERMAMQPSSQPPVQPVAPPVASPVPPAATPVQPVVQPAAPPVAPPAAPPVAPVAAPPVTPAAPARKEPLLSLILSFLGMFVFGFIGLGQVYNGQVKKAIILTVGNWVLGCGMFIIYIIAATVTLGVGGLCCLPILLLPLILWFYAMYDAYIVADKINKGELTKDWLS